MPWDDLRAEAVPEHGLSLWNEIAPVLAVLAGQGPTVPRLIATDDAGRLIVTGAVGAPSVVRIQDGTSAGLSVVTFPSDSIGQPPGLVVESQAYLWDPGVGSGRLARNASATNVAGQSGIGVALNAPAGEWQVSANPAVGAQATASQAAAGAGVRHVARRVSFGFSSQAALAAVSSVTFNLRDGATGAGTIRQAWTFDLPAAIIAPFAIGFEVNVLGTAATAMTLETAAAIAGLRVFANLSGYDAS